MKDTPNRSKKMPDRKESKPLSGNKYFKSHDSFDEPHQPVSGGMVYGLVKDILLATKVAQAAKQAHLGVHNFDKAEPLLEHAKTHKPSLVILDWDGCEAEAFKVLKEMNQNADLTDVTNVGYLSGAKTALAEEARRAGCRRVYAKTEFLRQLQMIVARCLS